MTTFFLYLTTLALTSGFELEGSGVVRSAVFVDQSGLLRMLRTDTGAVQWTAEIGGPLVWAEGLEEGLQVQFYPRLNGDLLVRKDQSGIRKMERGVKELARAGETEFDWEYYFKGSVSSSTFSIDVRTGSPDPLPSSHCPSLLIHRITYSLSLIDKRDLKPVSELYVSEIATSGCLESGNREGIVREYGAVWVLGEYVAEEEGWGSAYPVSLGVFVLFALYVGFKLGRQDAAEGKGVSMSVCRSPQCGTAAAPTTPSITPKRSAGSSPQPPLYRAKADLTVITTKRMPRDSLEQETPLIPSSDTRINDLLSNGRFQATFESVHLVHEQDGQRVYEARHILEGRKYVVKVAKFEYDETKTIAQVEMFREVAAMMRFRHKNVVNYVTSWVEDTDAQSPHFPVSDPCSSEDPKSPVSTGYLYIQSELVQGKSLQERLGAREKVDRRENCLLFRQMLKGVAHIHSKRIVHRGLEPSCLYVTGDNTVKIGGFHFAAKARASRHSFFQNNSIYSDLSTGLETNFPEQRDIYPLGLVLLEMCAAKQSSEEMSVLLSKSKERGEIPALMSREMRAEMEIVRWLTAVKPEKRPSALELLSSSLMRDWEREVGLSPSPVGLSPAHGPQ